MVTCLAIKSWIRAVGALTWAEPDDPPPQLIIVPAKNTAKIVYNNPFIKLLVFFFTSCSFYMIYDNQSKSGLYIINLKFNKLVTYYILSSINKYTIGETPENQLRNTLFSYVYSGFWLIDQKLSWVLFLYAQKQVQFQKIIVVKISIY